MNMSRCRSSSLDEKLSMCLSPQDKLKGSSKASVIAQHRKIKAAQVALHTGSTVLSSSTSRFKSTIMDIDPTDDLDLDLVDHDDVEEDMDAGWISDDNLRALDMDDRVNQDIDWVGLDETAIKLEFVPQVDDVQDFAFDSSSFLSPLRDGLALYDEEADMAPSFAESIKVESLTVSSQYAEKLLMSFDTMNFTIPSPTSSSTKKNRSNLFGKKEQEATSSTCPSSTTRSTFPTGSMSPSLKQRAGQSDEASARKELSTSPSVVPSEPLLGVLSITPPPVNVNDGDKPKIGSYSPIARKLRIQKFHEKRKNRTWKKSIKYDCRKKLADDRPRIKGRFVRVFDNANDMAIKDEPTVCLDQSLMMTMAPSSLSSPSVTPPPMMATPVMHNVSSTPVSFAAVAAIKAANAAFVLSAPQPPSRVPVMQMATAMMIS